MEELIQLREKNSELERNDHLYKETEKTGKIGGWQFDPATLKQTWTDQVFRILEMDLTQGAPEVPKGLEFIDPEFRPMAEKAIQRAIEHGEPYNQEWMVTTAKGNKRWVNAVCSPKMKNGEIITISGSFQDITSKKIVEEQLKALNQQLLANEQHLRAANQQLQASEQQLKAANQELSASEQQLLASNLQLKANEQHLKAANQQLQASEQQLQAANQELKASEQQLLAANQQLQANEQQLRAANRQLTTNEKDLVNSKETADRYLNVAAEIILALDSKGYISLLNESGNQLLGYEKGELIGKEWFSNCLPEDQKSEIRGVFGQIMKGKIENVAKYESNILTKSGEIKTILWHNTVLKDKNGNLSGTLSSGQDITEHKQAEAELKKIEWLLKPRKAKPEVKIPDYGDLTLINHERTILDSVGKEVLNGIVSDYLSMLETSAAVYEKNGDYAVGIFSSEWCQFMDCSSRALCESKNNKKALESGSWLCHESCWADASIRSIKTNEAVDIECNGGLHIYAIPIKANNEVIGAINFGYGNPPTDEDKLKEIAAKYKVPLDKLKDLAQSYETRPAFIIDIAKEKLETSARLIGNIVERKLTEKAFRESEEKYRLLHENAGLGIGYLNPEGIVLSFNTIAANDMNGVPEDFTGKSIFDLYPKDAASFYYERLQKAVNSDQIEVYEDFVQLPGQGKWFLSTYTKIVDSQNTILGIQIISQDITKIKQSEIELIEAKEKAEESERQLKLIADNFVNGMIYQVAMLDEDRRQFNYISQNVNKLYGCTVEEAKEDANLIYGKLHPDDIGGLIEKEKEALKNMSVFETESRVFTPDGNIRWAYYISQPRIINGIVCWDGVEVDITERKKMELELLKAKEKAEESEEKFSTIFNMSSSMICVADINTATFKFLNPAFKKVLGYEEKELLSKPFLDFIHPDDVRSTIDVIEKQLKAGIPQIYFENRYKRKDGNYCYLTWNSFPLPEKGITYAIAHDITEQKKIEKELIKAKEKAEESDRLKSAFLANMSHEIRTPMNGILGFSTLLKEPKLSGEQQQKYIGIIEKSGARMLNIINDIVDISKIEAGLMTLDIKESDINEQIEYIYTFFKPEVEAKGMKLSFKNTLPSKDAIIKTDREKVFAILTNLVKNAIKYTNKGSIEFGYNKKGNFIEFFVEDTGIGISKNRQEAIFERFIQADIEDVQARQGAGLGLSISKAYVEMLGGKIWVESEEGNLPARKVGGSTFYFTIPYNAPSKEETRHDTIDVSADSLNLNLNLNLKILIVEDDETSSDLLSIIVDKYGKEIISVANGNNALEACLNNPDIDLIMMDIQLPGMNGYEVTRQIREFNKEVIIIAQTAYGLSGDREKALDAGCNDYISKPINKDEFDALMRKYFRK